MKTPRWTYHTAVTAFKRDLLLHTLTEHGGNRTQAALTLGIQRTYLIRLLREHGVWVPPPRWTPKKGQAKK